MASMIANTSRENLSQYHVFYNYSVASKHRC